MNITPFKEGDKMYHVLYGWVIVKEINDRHKFVIIITKDDEFVKILIYEANTMLSFTEYTLKDFSNERPCLIEKDQLVYVRDFEDGEWKMRYFSHYENDTYYCFDDQKKSTGIKRRAIHWKFCETENPLLKNK